MIMKQSFMEQTVQAFQRKNDNKFALDVGLSLIHNRKMFCICQDVTVWPM